MPDGTEMDIVICAGTTVGEAIENDVPKPRPAEILEDIKLNSSFESDPVPLSTRMTMFPGWYAPVKPEFSLIRYLKFGLTWVIANPIAVAVAAESDAM